MTIRLSATKSLTEEPVKIITAAMSPYTVLDTDEVLGINTTAGPVEILLPAAATQPAGRGIVVFDLYRQFSSNACTITPNGVDTVDGAASRVMSLTGETANPWCNGANAWLSATVNQSGIDDVVSDMNKVNMRLVQVVITAVGGTGGSTDGTISVQVNNRDGTPVNRAVELRLDISDTELAGSLDPASTCQFGAATTGTIVVGTGAAAAIVTTDATGLYEGALSNAADETNYFSASTSDGGASASGCTVANTLVTSATWSA